MHLLDSSSGRKPTQVAAHLGLTRTNAYKILDQLCEYDLARKSEIGKTYRYFAEDPIALASFAAKARNHALELEHAVKNSVGELQKRYHKQIKHAEVRTAYGRTALLQAYGEQIKKHGELHFIKSRMDIPFLGFETMDRIRREPVKHGMKRYGITPAAPEVPTDPTIDAVSNLQRTLIPAAEYTSPVEWAVSGDQLTILKFTDNGTAITIQDEVIASAFLELWRLFNKSIHSGNLQHELTKHACRNV